MRLVLFHFPSLRLGGDTFVFDAARAWADAGHDVKVVTSDYTRTVSGTVNLDAAEVRRRLGKADLVEVPHKGLLLSPASRDALRRAFAGSDVVYAKNEVLDLAAALRARGDVPVACGAHTAIRYPHGRGLRWRAHNLAYLAPPYGAMLRRCAGVHVLNPEDEALVVQRFRVPAARVRRIPLGVDLHEYRPRPGRGDRFRVLFVGKLDEQKGVDVLARAFARLPPEAARGLHLTAVGRGPMRGELDAIGGTQATVEVPGFVPQEGFADLVARHDLAVVPSRWETLSYVAVEALACGVPVLASDVPGPSSVVTPGVDGWLVPPADDRALAEGLLRAHALWQGDPAAYARMRAAARASAEARFDAKARMDEVASWLAGVARVEA